MSAHPIERANPCRSATGRLARPGTAVAIAVASLILSTASAPLASSAHLLTISGGLLTGVLFLAFVGVGAAVAYKRPLNRMGWMLLGVAGFVALTEVGGTYSVLDYRIHHARLPLGWLAVLMQPSWAPMIVLVALAIILYPDGQLPSRRWRWPMRWFCGIGAAWVLGAYAIAFAAGLFGPIRVTPTGDLVQIDKPAGGWVVWGVVQDLWFATLAVTFVAWLVSQLLGYRRLSGDRRLQQKWIISGAAVCFLGGMGSIALSSAGGGMGAIGGIAVVGIAPLPVAMGIGILKYRLYEIDRIVSRTLSYALLTGLLVGTFLGLVTLTTDVLPFSSTVAVAASTLAAAALFNPVRVRVQRLVDRRFNRARYDAEATVAAFAARLRDAVDLDAVQAELLAVVHHAVEPTHATVWVRPAHHSTRFQTPG